LVAALDIKLNWQQIVVAAMLSMLMAIVQSEAVEVISKKAKNSVMFNPLKKTLPKKNRKP
jgi:hypothetical protein